MIFYNELLSVILRTVWSVILLTPKHLLQEIILVDDSSTDGTYFFSILIRFDKIIPRLIASIFITERLKGLLDYYVDTRLKDYNIKIIHLKSRLGLIRARLQGARIATGNSFLVIYFYHVLDYISYLLISYIWKLCQSEVFINNHFSIIGLSIS